MLKVTLAILTTIFFVSCKDKAQKVSAPITTLTPKNKITDTTFAANKVKATDYVFSAVLFCTDTKLYSNIILLSMVQTLLVARTGIFMTRTK